MPGLVRSHPDLRAVTRCRSPRLARVGGWSDLAWLIPSAGSDQLILATCSLSTSVLVCVYKPQRRDQTMSTRTFDRVSQVTVPDAVFGTAKVERFDVSETGLSLIHI